MTSPLDALVEAVSALVYKDTVLLKLCFNLVFYSLDLSQPDQKRAVLQIYDEYGALYGSKFKWTTNPNTGNWKKLKNGPASYVTPHDWLLNEPAKNGFEFLYHGSENNEEASDVTLFAFGENLGAVMRHDLGIVFCRFPLNDVLNGHVKLPELFYRWCSSLKPYHAHGGFCIGRCPDELGKLKYFSSLEVDLLLQFPGLQLFSYDECIYWAASGEGLYNGPRCADWLIALSDPFVAKLGGVEAIAQKMHPLPYQAYDGGIALQAGAAPGLGEKTGRSLPDYMHLARVIEPVRAKPLAPALCLPYNDPLLAKLGLPPGNPNDERTYPRELSDMWYKRFSPEE
jgi:hypothetical protein